MASYYHVLVDLDLAGDVDEDDLAGVRWLVGQGPLPRRPLPAQSHGEIAPIVDPAVVAADAAGIGSPFGTSVPGGARASLLLGRGAAPPFAPTWSLSVRALHTEAYFLDQVLPALEWLTTVSGTEGLVATARDTDEALPYFYVLALGRRPYYLHDGQVQPFQDDDPPAPPWVQDEAAQLSGLARRSA